MDHRIARSRMLVIAAAVDELSDQGWARASVDRISEASGVAKTTLYRHWKDRAALLLDAAEASLPAKDPVETGSLRGDLVAALGDFGRSVQRGPSGAVVASLMDAARRDADAARMLGVLAERLAAPLSQVLERAGMPAAPPDVDRLAGPVFMRTTLRRKSLRRSDIEVIVDAYLA